jgi:hypothetical protein
MTQETRRRIEAVRYWLEALPAERQTGADEVRTPRFSRGIEMRPAPLERLHVGRFSDGIEALPEDAGWKGHIGRFSDGIEALPEDLPSKRHIGRFSDGAGTHAVHGPRPAA